MQKMNKKQLLNHRINAIVVGILNTLTDDEVTVEIAKATLPKTTQYKDSSTGEIRIGFSWKGVRKLVKKYPYVDVSSAKLYFGMQ
jgi:hypothetical protein